MWTANLKNLIAAWILSLIIVCTASGAIIAVNPGESIQAAIDSASYGDTVEVAAGTYIERITLKDGVAVIGAGAGDTVIDANGIGRVVYSSDCDENTVLEGFTITGGNAIGSSFPDNCGGGMLNNGSSPTVTNCTFIGNLADLDGGGMYCENSSPTVTNCTLRNNSANYGGGMSNYASSPTVTNCNFIGNSADYYGGGMFNFPNSGPTVTSCIIWGNTAPTGPQIYGGFPSVTYSDVQGGYAGMGNINADPCFVDADGGNLRPSYDSPCIDTGNNAGVPAVITADLDGHPRILDGDCDETAVVDMGAYEFNYAYMGDLDYNCRVDFFDFSIFGQAWMTKESDSDWDWACDISDPPDNYIDWRDVAVLCDNWLATP